LPVAHGDEVCGAVSAAGGEARVLMLTASAEVDDRVAGLGIGADDYLTAVMTLRRKLGQPALIETVPGAGYRFDT
jgi:DNA-binding response OmpR family regulator